MFGAPQSPLFGNGATRRRIRLTSEPGSVFAELEDHAHAMRLRLTHDGGRITAVEPDFHRYPLLGCPGAEAPLQALVGEPVGEDAGTFFSGGRARRNCTHMFDLAWLAGRQALRGPGQRLYALDIPDEESGRQEITASCNGVEILRLIVENGEILSPPPFAGRHIFRGFASWLIGAEGLSETEVELALMAQKLSLIVPARRFVIPAGPATASEKQAVVGACYSYAPERVDQVVRSRVMRRDFSQRPDDLLRFL